MMKGALGSLEGTICHVYIDDIMIVGEDEHSHLQAIQKVLACLESHNLRLKPSKCEWFQTETTFVGYQISEQGIEIDPDRIRIIRDWPRPQNVKDIRKFMGMLQYYRKFIKDFAKISSPLTELTKDKIQWCWSEPRENAFQTLKSHLTSPPILSHPNFDRPFILTTDASGFAIGGVLSQEIDELDRPIAFGPRQLNDAEKNYSAHRQEALAMVYFVQKYRHYLFGKPFILRTDCRALTYLMNTTSKQTAVLARYVEVLSNYKFEVQHRPGVSNKVADALSRYPTYEGCKCCTTDSNIGHIDTVTLSEPSWMTSISKEEMELAQITDPVLKSVRQWVQNGDNCAQDELLENQPLLKSYWNLYKKCQIKYGLLWYVDTKNDSHRLIVPETFKAKLLELVHDHKLSGHRGVKNTLDRLKNKFFWIGMKKNCENWVESCEICVASKRSIQVPPLQEPCRPNSPDEKLCIDCIGPLPQSKEGYRYALCVMDDISKFAQAFPLRSMTAKETASVLVNNYFCPQGVIPNTILSDRGTNFTSELFREVCDVLSVKGLTTLPYSPSSNGAIERWNNTLKTMLRAYVNKNSKWVDMLPFLSLAHNSTVHSATGFSPDFLHRGRKCRLPAEIIFPTAREVHTQDYNEYARQLDKKLGKAVQFAKMHLQATHERYKRERQKHVQFESLNVGDKVLVKDCVKPWSYKRRRHN